MKFLTYVPGDKVKAFFVRKNLLNLLWSIILVFDMIDEEEDNMLMETALAVPLLK